ncbi:hypothetical protein G3I15_58195, partial [Streptomyces sp. SID10244]|nr:hypothetical protein [Streptomyces sp. SID10244]
SARRWAGVLDELPQTRPAEAELWQQRLPQRDTVLGRRLDRTRHRERTVTTITSTVDATVSEAVLTRVAAAFHTGTDQILVAALITAIERWQRAQPDSGDADRGV